MRRVRGVVALWLGLALAAPAAADEIRRWRDADGTLHVEIVGDGSPVDPDAEGMPLLSTSELSPDEKFSVATSRSRRQLARGIDEASAVVKRLEEEIARAEAEKFVVYTPPTARSPKEAQFLLDAQRNAFLAAQRFKQDQEDRVRRMRGDRLKRLRELSALWARFGELRDSVRERYGEPPAWWRDELDCRSCLSAAEVEAALERRDEPDESTRGDSG